jgi:hypothetical protein
MRTQTQKLTICLLENVSYDGSAGEELFLSHHVRDAAFDTVMHLTASISIILVKTTFKTHARCTRASMSAKLPSLFPVCFSASHPCSQEFCAAPSIYLQHKKTYDKPHNIRTCQTELWMHFLPPYPNCTFLTFTIRTI